MNYEEKYKEALERARNLHKDAIDMGENLRAKQCEIIFPELVESEDEKIRKSLITFFQRFPYTNLYDAGLNAKEVIAWLEKQAEQKPTNEDMKTLLRTEYEKGRADAIAEMQKEWSEEDEENMKKILDAIGSYYYLTTDDDILCNWLKSLRPQNRWKPSETDIMILEKVFNGKIDPKDFQVTLSNVLEQLKKLKEGKV